MDNMSINLKNLNIWYENHSLFGVDTRLRIRIDDITLNTTDLKENPIFV
jgi:hypothetical protein